ncbi:MAG TPA: hypothetical protein VHU84_08205 [Lacipirellulaceae bacterium]|jgi:uncharacterized protein (DUF983 family)|nr:hypothetical protein [Lacipirellulaceae bacterium]
MHHDDPDDEDWYDDDEPEEAEELPCPECGKRVVFLTDKCPACGYWLSADDRRRFHPAESKPAWIKLVVIVLIAIFLYSSFRWLF